MINLDPPPGFRGLHPDKPVQWYFRNLPHARQNGATYFVTFRLGDSLPQSKLDELEILRQEFAQKFKGNPPRKEAEKYSREVLTRIEKWLDLGEGECQLKTPACGNEINSAMKFFDGRRYELDCFAVMPNHVHLVVRPTDDAKYPLEKILQSWKRHSALNINRILGRQGKFWQPESYDRIVRDTEHLYRVVQYIGRNPKLAKLVAGEYSLWIRRDWVEIGWGFRDD